MRTPFLSAALIGLGLVLGISGASVADTSSAPLLAADTSGGYGAQVLEKLAKTWQPPAGVSGAVTVSIRIGSDGRPLYCEPVKSSGNTALDNSSCQAVLHAGTFETPPYGAITQVFVTLATDRAAFGTQEQDSSASPQRSYAEEIMYRAHPYIQIPQGVHGEFTVELALRISPSGTLEEFSVLQSSGRADLDNAVIASITREGVIPVPPAGSSTQNVRLLFTLKGN